MTWIPPPFPWPLITKETDVPPLYPCLLLSLRGRRPAIRRRALPVLPDGIRCRCANGGLAAEVSVAGAHPLKADRRNARQHQEAALRQLRRQLAPADLLAIPCCHPASCLWQVYRAGCYSHIGDVDAERSSVLSDNNHGRRICRVSMYATSATG